MGGTPPASPRPGVDSSLGDELPEAAMRPLASSGWSDLPSDLLLSILQRLELPQALAFAAVCTSWCSVAAAAGVPRRSCTPWLMSWADSLREREQSQELKRVSATTCKFRHLLDVDKAYDVEFHKGSFVACCGASHGWLVLVNQISDLLLFNPFTSDTIPLPPTTDFACVEAVYGSRGSLEHYLFEKDQVHDANSLGTWFYQKAVLSCRPSKDGADYTVMIIHRDSDWLSFARAGQSRWRVASVLAASKQDRYADCVHHDESFYTVTLHGVVERCHDLDGPDGPNRETVVANRHYAPILTRHLVSATWGDLLHVRSVLTNRRSKYPDSVRFQIRKVDLGGGGGGGYYREVSRRELAGHAMFLGLNHSACLPAKGFPGVRPRFIYFSAPWTNRALHLLGRRRDWGRVRAYDLTRRTSQHAFVAVAGDAAAGLGMVSSPSEVWITPNL